MTLSTVIPFFRLLRMRVLALAINRAAGTPFPETSATRNAICELPIFMKS